MRTNSRKPPSALRRAVLPLLAALFPAAASAQSAQMLSLQFSLLGVYPFGGEMDRIDVGAGWEAQLRVNPSAFSIGAGAEQTFHQRTTGQDIVMLGGFLEPRYVIDIGQDNAVMYVSGRAAISQITIKDDRFETTSTGYTLNGGGGFLFRLTDNLNLDVGATVGYKDLGAVTLATIPIDLGTGANLVGRVGLAIGLG